MKHIIQKLLTALCLFMPFVQAQAETIVLDLQQSAKRAMATDPRAIEKEKLVDKARGLLHEAEGAKDLMVGVNSFVGLAPKLRGGLFETTDGKGNKVIGVPDNAFDINGVTPWYYLDFSLIKPLYTFGKVKNYTKAAENNIKVKQGDVELRRGENYQEVAQAYYGYLAARDTRLFLEDTLDKMKAAADLVKGWLNNGGGQAKQSDLYALQTGVALLQRYIAEAKGLENIAMTGLRLLTGVQPQDTLELADKRLKPVPLPEGDMKNLQAKALKQRPEVKQLEAGLDARRALMMAKKSEADPNIYAGFVGVISYTPERGNLTSVNVYDPFYTAGATPILGMKWDWSTGRQPAQVEQAKAELDATLALKSYAQQGIPFQVAEQYTDVHSYYEMVNKLYDASRNGRRWMISTYADFEAGVEKADKVISAFLGYIQAYSDYLKTVNAYNLHVVQLEVVTGEIK
jgi:outer membrane protein